LYGQFRLAEGIKTASAEIAATFMPWAIFYPSVLTGQRNINDKSF
jgi:hypothetical protein